MATLAEPASAGVAPPPLLPNQGRAGKDRRAVEGMTGGPGVEGKGGSSKIEFKFFPGSIIHENFTEAR